MQIFRLHKSSLRRSCSAFLLGVLLTLAHCAFASGWQPLGNVSKVAVLPDGVDLTVGTAHVRIVALSSNIVRLRYAPHGTFPPDHSFALVSSDRKAPKVRVRDENNSVQVDAGDVRVAIRKSPLRITFEDSSGTTVLQEHPDYPVSFNGTSFHVWESMPEDEHYFGLGDKGGSLDHRDESFTMWNKDVFGYQESTDPRYKTIPFLVGMRNGNAYGLFLDNTWRSSWDIGKESRDFFSFGADGGELNYYFIYGPDPKRVVTDFTGLTGRTPLPPLFSLGYQQSRYSYYPEARVREIVHELRTRKIPADAIYLDIDYQENNRPFTVDRERFPNFEGMIKDLGSQGMKVINITDLHIAKVPGAKSYEEGLKGDHFVKNPDGSVYVGKVWPGDSVFPDFTRAATRDWWGTLYTDFTKAGVRGFWNDMNEPALFERGDDKTMPLGNIHHIQNRPEDGGQDRLTDHREIHNVFGMQNVRATYDGLLKLNPNQRPFVLTRAAYAGTQRYAATWTGDNSASWNHMRLSIYQLLNLGISGYAFSGVDVGGFNGSPNPELLTRWHELGLFYPMYRNHAAKETRNREPWVDGAEHEAIRKRYIETRYKLLPYIYTGMEENSRTGIPLLRPMFMEFPKELGLAGNGDEFMFGRSFLVAPKVWGFLQPYNVTLPPGTWYDYWTGARLDGGKTFPVEPPLDTLPVYVRAGSIVPQQAVIQYVEEIPQGPLELHVYPGPNCSGEIYVDDGTTFAYRDGRYLRQSFTCNAAADHLEITMKAPGGTYQPWFKEVRFTVHGVDGKISSLVVDEKPSAEWKAASGTLVSSSIPWDRNAHNITLAYPRP